MSQTNQTEEPWRAFLQNLSQESSAFSDLQSRAARLADAVKGQPDITKDIVYELTYQAGENPASIDPLLRIYSELAKYLDGVETVKEYGFTGSAAVHKALDAEILECSQTPGEAIEKYAPYDVSCPIQPDEDMDAAAERVIDFANARRWFYVVHALIGRGKVLDAGKDDGEALSMVKSGLGLEKQQPDEANYIGALIIILSTGNALGSVDELRLALEARLKSESSFRLKVLTANAIKALKEGRQWSSSELFGSGLWIY